MSDLPGGPTSPPRDLNALTRKLNRLSRLDAGDRAALEGLERHTDWLPAGARIVPEGDPPRAIRPLLEGVACGHKDFRDGRRQIIALLLPGDLCGGHGRLHTPMDHGVRALTRVKIASLDAAAFDEMLRGHPAIAEALHKVALVEQAILRAWIVNLGQRAAQQRMAHLFCELAHRIGDGGLLVAGGGFRLPLTQLELGSALGLTSVHVNRVLQRLRTEALINFDHGVLRIHDLGRLQNLADFDPAYLSN